MCDAATKLPIEEKSNNTLMTLVFSGSSALPDATRMEVALRQALPDLPESVSGGAEPRAALAIPYQNMLVVIMGVEAPAPMAANDPQFTNAWYWPQAWKELSAHKSHIVVSVSGGADGAARARLILRVLGAIIGATPEVIGVCNTTSGTLLPVNMVSSLVKQSGSVATPLFVSCYFAREAEGAFPKPGILASTKGLGDFGLMEIEARGFPGSMPDLHQFIIFFAAYLIAERANISDGHTIGRDANERIKIHIRKSMFYDAQVYCLFYQ